VFSRSTALSFGAESSANFIYLSMKTEGGIGGKGKVSKR
jgi:hypothetical protein